MNLQKRSCFITVTDYDHYFYSVEEAASDWTAVTVKVTDLKQEGWGKKVPFQVNYVNKFAWAVKGADVTPDYLKVRNFTCEGKVNATAPLMPSSSSSSVRPGYSSSSAVRPGYSSSSNANGGVNGGNNGDINGGNNGGINGGFDTDAISVSMAQSGLKVLLRGNSLNITVARAGLVKVQVFDMMGHIIDSRSDYLSAGSYAHDYNGIAKGTYMVRVQQGSVGKSVRMQVR